MSTNQYSNKSKSRNTNLNSIKLVFSADTMGLPLCHYSFDTSVATNPFFHYWSILWSRQIEVLKTTWLLNPLTIHLVRMFPAKYICE